jgi:KDO2-lipid IV(A) lauroyltransferase
MPKRRRGIPKPLHAPLYWSIRAVAGAAGALDLPTTTRFARQAGRAFGGAFFNRKRLERGVENLKVAFPGWTADQRTEYALRAYEHLFELGVEMISTPRVMHEDSWLHHVQLENLGPGLAHLLSGRPAVLVTGHCGNWELLGYTLSLLGFPIQALYRPLDLKPLDAWVRRTRQARGMVLLDKFGAGDELPEIMRAGGAPAFVADQNAGDRGLFVPFFGRLASAYKSVGLLAMRYQCPVLCGLARRLERVTGRPKGATTPPTGLRSSGSLPGADLVATRPPHPSGLHYGLHITDIIEPADWADQPDPLFYITARYRRAIEAMVHLAPEQYLWMHRYWKSRPRHERLGRPFPGNLREKLEALPWMTQNELEGILEYSARDTIEARKEAPLADEPAAAEASTPS